MRRLAWVQTLVLRSVPINKKFLERCPESPAKAGQVVTQD